MRFNDVSLLLGVQSRCPVFVRKSVWEDNAMPLKMMKQSGSPDSIVIAAEEAVTNPLTSIRYTPHPTISSACMEISAGTQCNRIVCMHEKYCWDDLQQF